LLESLKQKMTQQHQIIPGGVGVEPNDPTASDNTRRRWG
jgi:hypothetical protein